MSHSIQSFQFQCPLPNGIHARPATHLEKQCQQFECQITLTNLRTQQSGDAKSVLSLVGTDTLLNDLCEMRFEGVDSEQACAALQHYIEQEFPHCDEALETLADESDIILPQSLTRLNPTLISGKRLATGIAQGQLIAFSQIEPEHFATEHKDEQEETRFTTAHQQVCHALSQKIANATAQEKEIIESHLAIVNDSAFVAGIKQHLADHSTANAILAEVERVSAQLRNASSSYLRERVLDIKDVAIQLLTAAYPEKNLITEFTINKPSVVIANDLTPSQFLGLDREHLQGLVLTHAGSTSHTVILARAFGIPTLSGIELSDCTKALNQTVYLDANLGVLAVDATPQVAQYFHRAIKLAQTQQEKQNGFAQQKATTQDGHCIEVAANIACSIEAEGAFNQGAEGIGLFRTEMLFMDRSQAPDEEEQFNHYRQVLEAANGKPVIIRTMDIGGDKPIDYLQLPEEHNPFLGYRAVRIYPQFLTLFHTQLKAILRAAQYGKAKMMIPMIQSIEEIRWVKEQLEVVKAELSSQGVSYSEHLELGIMVEIPAVAFIVDQFCQEVDFFSIGSNDMTQYLLAVDRDNAQVAKLYNSLAPSFLRMLNQVVTTAHQHNKWVGLCGELGADAKVLPLLVGAGLDEISMGAPKIAATKSTLATLDFAHCQQLFADACQCCTISDVEQLLNQASSAQPGKALLSQDCVFKHADFSSKEEVIQALVGNLGVQGRCDNAYKLEEDVWAREAVFSTGLGHGFAIPHTKSENIRHSSISIAHLETPIDWQSDSGDVDFVIMLTLNKDQGDQHMRIFSSLARKLIHQSFRDMLRDANNEAEVIRILEQELAL
ncbi:phosphoenolpyruvate--protein phosphotransferase [Photobacterium damselae]|uniref:phosphoenolpyruvate--protein phosphotransferase n=1 Tax=Photobacterium damselae TaxID=38293 RepID=UPI001EEEDD4C|nr:phosphoenolpyruvate--protein phosphotransferase [Photobacterium damselae]UKA11957.1 phosphoenolpyruvate--protein phosphotransferase [Photobacterium damselae subsp. damselae]